MSPLDTFHARLQLEILPPKNSVITAGLAIPHHDKFAVSLGEPIPEVLFTVNVWHQFTYDTVWGKDEIKRMLKRGSLDADYSWYLIHSFGVVPSIALETAAMIQIKSTIKPIEDLLEFFNQITKE